MKNSKKVKANAPQKQAVPPQPSVQQPGKVTEIPRPSAAWLEKLEKGIDEVLDEEIKPLRELKSALAKDEDCAGIDPAHEHGEGASHLDESGCIGGSLAHTHGEGAARQAAPAWGMYGEGAKPGEMRRSTEGPGNIAAGVRMQEKAAKKNAPAKEEKRAFSAKDMRRAVVTSEILGKPVSLRPRNARP